MRGCERQRAVSSVGQVGDCFPSHLLWTLYWRAASPVRHRGSAAGVANVRRNETDLVTASVSEAVSGYQTGDCFLARKLRSLVAMTLPWKAAEYQVPSVYSADVDVIPS
jgi:hypothetical protein